jgi:hypothetical protein
MQGWGAAHRAALACGALLTYAWVGYVNSNELDISRAEALGGSVIFSALAVLLVAVVSRRPFITDAVAPPGDVQQRRANPGSASTE